MSLYEKLNHIKSSAKKIDLFIACMTVPFGMGTDYTYSISWELSKSLRVSTFRFVDVLVCRRFGLSTSWFVDVSACRRFGLSTFRFVDVLVCRRFGLSTLRLVAVLICRCLGLSTFWLWTFRFVDVLTCNHLFYSFIIRNEQNKVSAFLRHIISITMYACSLQYHSAGSHLTMNQWMVSTTFARKQLSYIIFISCYTCIHIYIIFHKVNLMQNPKL